MGYACPVCSTPQRDGEHLAHHLAFTAMIHGDDHEAWLDEHVPDWGGQDPSGLAEAVVPHAEEVEYHEVFEDTVDRGRPDVGGYGQGQGQERKHGHGHGHEHEHGTATRGHAERGRGVQPDGMDPETAAAIRKARELTREMYDNDDPDASGDDGPDGSDEDGDDGNSDA